MRRPLSILGDHRTSAGPSERPDPAGVAQLVVLAYELLDAHADTAELAGELTCDPRWDAHLEYLRALQRIGREALAHVALPASVGTREVDR